MTDFLLELRCEEIPARMQAGARADLAKLFARELSAAGLNAGEVTVWSTPRRLALIARDLPMATKAVSEETKGPKTSAPEQALEGFLRKTGLTKDQLTERDGVWFAVTEKPGRATADVLAEAIPAIIRAFPWPKSQRWGAASLSTESLRWVRPLSGIVAILGEDLVECEIGGIHSGYATRGHRFHCPGEITIGSAHDYAEKLRACHVIVDHAEREALIRDKAKAVAEAAELVLVEDEGLVIENAGLTEWPAPLLGRFDESFLEVPPEVIQLTARINQKYFICRDAAGKLANAFVCTANIEAKDHGVAIVDGNRKVLAARLSDARFFWEQDKKKPLSVHAEKLARITFHEKLGTVADKVDRVAKLARWLVEEGIVTPQTSVRVERSRDTAPGLSTSLEANGSVEQLADQAELAARLCKADLVTEMVGEFPELQGLMGGYYARAEGLPAAVADAIRDHYKPVGQGDDVPTAPVTVAVALADKLDSLNQFFVEGLTPTGSKDPFALRRQAIGVLSIIQNSSLRLPLRDLTILEMAVGLAGRFGLENRRDEQVLSEALTKLAIKQAVSDLREPIGDQAVEMVGLVTRKAVIGYNTLIAFFADRLKVQQREAGVRHDLIDAVFALGGEDDLVRLLARVHALQAFVTTEDGTNLLAGYKRAANILKKEAFTPVEADYAREPAEQALVDALNVAEPLADSAIAAEDFTAAMAALASLRAPIDAFFESVTVNDADAGKRASRLALLDRFRAAVHKVADFSRIEG
ncbi:glycine--tRNA ligase subunit beta [Novosphingobium sp. MMS21-SN21R]|uniref:glycine--tRNA ligase subunit beta n=1 Tax=Novosphingobium sp. MMS21-SN21R TaxID=2969298 RepID=UPI0028839E2C|nr:glycine--tRNA ligase subunit beta [Novosphingobium sp. MMS21-SN21R]MDT0507879.1 glycine--tRNA ligase subunit beta [Novosphingobium sp. MMS21-SN21R]